tara:strand:- start:36 stop:221 length:186 start_codon:yes stop_codon:yes gene_type:complete
MKIKNILIEGVDSRDYPDFVDAYVSYAEHSNGNSLTEDELDLLNADHPEIAQEHAFETLLN